MAAFKHFPEQFLDSLPGDTEDLSALYCYPVDPAISAAADFALRKQIALSLEPMQQRIHGAWANRIPMTRQLFDHALPINSLFIRMVQNVHTDQPAVEVAIIQQMRHALS